MLDYQFSIYRQKSDFMNIFHFDSLFDEKDDETTKQRVFYFNKAKSILFV